MNVTFVNFAGERTRLPGRVGDSLFDVARRHKYEHLDGACGGGGSPRDVLHKSGGGWYEPKYGEGAQVRVGKGRGREALLLAGATDALIPGGSGWGVPGQPCALTALLFCAAAGARGGVCAAVGGRRLTKQLLTVLCRAHRYSLSPSPHCSATFAT